MRDSFTPGQVWLDNNGARIHAHGGSIIQVAERFYWYGENKERSTPGSGIWHWGVRCYSSTDLYNWDDEGVVIPPEPHDPASPMHPSKGMDRPHIIYNAPSRKFVCWVKVMDGARQRSSVFTADSILGPYQRTRTDLKPLGMNAGDFDLVVSPSDAKAYYYFERVHSELICADLTDDYTDVAGYYSTHFPAAQPPFTREAPAYFHRAGLHYLITSGTTGYYPNPSEAAVAPTFHGPWRVLGDPHPGDPSRTSFHSQISSVFKHPAKQDLYIALADRWLPRYRADSAEALKLHQDAFWPGSGNDHHAIGDLTEVDTSIADYVWLPIRFEGQRPYLDWRDEWRVEDYR
ncbi:MAG: family 43 glycosylhydrolase [Bifidobacteriaceae bacterium]|jgi:hypothetical protein|nr:family 43 glycosylhydrolase [Bifidobacteriaceae bacterium]